MWRRWVAGMVALLLVLLGADKARAGDWITKGGSPQRRSVVAEPHGLTELTAYWETKPLGESATQPAVVNGVIYHLFGPFLWRIELDQTGRPRGEATIKSRQVV